AGTLKDIVSGGVGVVSFSQTLSHITPTDDDNRFAYAFCLFGMTSKNDGAGYKPYIGNVLVAAELFKNRYGMSDNVDIVLYVSMQDDNDSLWPEDEKLLETMNVKLKYYDQIIAVDSTKPKYGWIEATMNKVILLNSTEYTRILHLDSDVLPLASLEYIFELSAQGIFKENMIIGTGTLPMNAGFFMVTPSQEGFQQALDLMEAKRLYAKTHKKWDAKYGWAGVDYFASDETPPALKNHPKDSGFRAFSWYGADADQGLFYIWPRFIRKSMTHMLHDRFVNYGPGGPNNTLSLIESVHYYREKGHVNPFLVPHTANEKKNATSALKASNCQRYGACNVPNLYWHHMHFLDQEKGKATAKPQRYFILGTHMEEYYALLQRNQGQNNVAVKPPVQNPMLLWWDTLMELEVRLDFNFTRLWLPNATTIAAAASKEIGQRG
ncbi:MAG: hypothetical protein SGILL_009761, partial [Bacillariaceae sp.]